MPLMQAMTIRRPCMPCGHASLRDSMSFAEPKPPAPVNNREAHASELCRTTGRHPWRVRGCALPLNIAVVPDRVFSLALPNSTRHNFALGLDRDTMDIKAKRIAGKPSFRRKLLDYFHAWRERKHTDTWGFHSFRVLTITTSEKRIANMMAAQHEITNGSAAGLFLYTTPDRL